MLNTSILHRSSNLLAVFTKVEDSVLEEIRVKVNMIIGKIPDIPSKFHLHDNWRRGRYFLRFKNKGFYEVQLLDHAQINVYYLGKTISDIVKNIVKNHICIYDFLYQYTEEKESSDDYMARRERGRNYFYHCVADDIKDAATPHSVFNNLRQQDFLSFINKHAVAIDEQLMAKSYHAYCLCYDDIAGYLFVTNLENKRIAVFKLGLSDVDAAKELPKVLNKVQEMRLQD